MSTPTWTTHSIGATSPYALLPPDCEGHRGAFGTRAMEGILVRKWRPSMFLASEVSAQRSDSPIWHPRARHQVRLETRRDTSNAGPACWQNRRLAWSHGGGGGI